MANEMQKTTPFGMRDKVGYMFGDFANDFTFILSSSFLMKFYTDVMGVSAGVVGAPGLRKGCGRADTRQEAGHVASLHGARLLGNAHCRDLGQIKLPAKLLQHLGQSRGMVEERITLP